ncbi:unnamed protein product [Adineta steineri]|uniref:NAD(P)(+)--arginine ADP-ribosyltransferase n=1 Tax=Adineta steineri TaxID=433720 RepID=A0A816AQM6_9BILA|nr:unnamed protein product [Adineta steineri]CAF1362740.1 unnamed protein product [Adineta steineri]CAF1497466.1 unnamed protein product [Adineta steineri]CAF1600693.1 unnamed protein product [Adineta steineri]
MELDPVNMRLNRFVDDNISELQAANRNPIYGYQELVLMPLEQAVEKIAPFIDNITKYVQDAKRNCNHNLNILTWDESAAIYLYTMSSPFFSSLNERLRAEDRHALKPWFAFLKLFLTALEKLPSTKVSVWRAVSCDVGSYYVANDMTIWWSVNSTSTDPNVIKMFLGETSTLFHIDAIYGKTISDYSAMPDEKEVILIPGTYLEVKSNPFNYLDHLFVVQMKEFTTEEYIQRDEYDISSEWISLTGGSIDRCHRLKQRNMVIISSLTLIILFILLLITCVHRKFRVWVDILYSFDCSNATDDISGTYNGIEVLPSWIPPNSEQGQLMLPAYITPDYSGQGVALKLDSSKPYQYIQLIHSPIFFNKTFTVSVWLNPNVEASKVYVVLSQTYASAPNLAICIIDQYAVIRVYKTLHWSSTKLKNFQWQYVTFAFSPLDLTMAIHIDGIFSSVGGIAKPEYGNFSILQTNIGSHDGIEQYNGIVDQLSIVFRIKNYIDILDEATLVVNYNFESDNIANDSQFEDTGVNSIRAQFAYVSHQTGNRHDDQGTLLLYNSVESYFQSGGFILLSTHNYSYSYTFWINVFNFSTFMPVIHLVARPERASLENNNSICLILLTINGTDKNKLQVSVYIYGSGTSKMIISSTLITFSTWFHVAFVSKKNSSSLFVNGKLVASLIGENTINFGTINQQRLTLTVGNPRRQSKNDAFYSSMCIIEQPEILSNQSVIGIDELRFYSRELKTKEIETLSTDGYVPSRFFFE